MLDSQRSLAVLPTTAYPKTTNLLNSMRNLSANDRFGVHTVTDDPDEADLILFVDDYHTLDDPMHTALRRHPWVAKYRGKTFAYVEADRPWCVLPGLYCSMPRRYFRASRQRACMYIMARNPLMEATAQAVREPDLLFSFIGAQSHKVRSGLLALRHPNAIVEDTTGFFNVHGLVKETAESNAIKRRYAKIAARSKFILCPRGKGTSSYRLFESLQAGRVPVILSDQWVPPLGPNWEAFSLRVPESRINDVPAILEQNEARWPEMASEARRAWDDWFAPDVRFHRMIESCAEILATRRFPEWVSQRVPGIPFLEWQSYMVVRPMVHRIRYRHRQE